MNEPSLHVFDQPWKVVRFDAYPDRDGVRVKVELEMLGRKIVVSHVFALKIGALHLDRRQDGVLNTATLWFGAHRYQFGDVFSTEELLRVCAGDPGESAEHVFRDNQPGPRHPQAEAPDEAGVVSHLGSCQKMWPGNGHLPCDCQPRPDGKALDSPSLS